MNERIEGLVFFEVIDSRTWRGKAVEITEEVCRSRLV
jgi:hypothetical protein